jgi:hypothetical protein
MVTTVIAIYGAVVATVSTLLGAWYFLYSGPRLQAEAYVYPPVEGNDGELDDEWFVALRVWNTGRAEVTADIKDIMIRHDNDWTGLLLAGADLDGPEVPARILGHSGASWEIPHFDIQYIVRRPFTSATFTVTLEVGGKREVNVSVGDGWHRKSKRPFILKPGPGLWLEPRL